MDEKKRYNTHGFTALSGLLEHAAVLEERLGAAVPPMEPVMPNAPSEVLILLADIQMKLNRVMEMLDAPRSSYQAPVRGFGKSHAEPTGHAVDGVYDGQGNMVSDDGTLYRVPRAYADKAGLREGDLMQVTSGSHGFNKFKKMRQ